jgi:hypothetical protein
MIVALLGSEHLQLNGKGRGFMKTVRAKQFMLPILPGRSDALIIQGFLLSLMEP